MAGPGPWVSQFNIVKFIIELKFAPRSRGGATIATIATIAGIASIADTSHETRDTNWSSGPQLSLVVAAVSLEVTAVWVGATTLCNFSVLVFALCKLALQVANILYIVINLLCHRITAGKGGPANYFNSNDLIWNSWYELILCVAEDLLSELLYICNVCMETFCLHGLILCDFEGLFLE